ALRGTSGPIVPATPDGGTEDVAATGRVGTVSACGPGAPFAAACALCLAALSDLCADLSCSDLLCSDLPRSDLPSSDLLSSDLLRSGLFRSDLFCSDLCCSVLCCSNLE